MRAHVSMIVSDVKKTVDFYSKVFNQDPQKQTDDYAKFDLKAPALNFTVISHPEATLSQVAHLGIEVQSQDEVFQWKKNLEKFSITTRDEMAIDCCYAHQDKIWFSDPDRNEWEIFYVKKQLEVPQGTNQTSCLPQSKCCQ